MLWDKTIFLINVDLLVSTRCNGVAKIFNERIKDRDAVTNWTKTNKRPSVPTLLKISSEFGVSIDWLLTGHAAMPTNHISEPPPTGEAYLVHGSSRGCDPECPLADRDPDMIDRCKKVRQVIDSDTSYSKALKENIDAFHEAVEERKRSISDMAALEEKMLKEMAAVESKYKDEIKTIKAEFQNSFDDLRSKIANHQRHVDEAVSIPPTGTDAGDGTGQ